MVTIFEFEDFEFPSNIDVENFNSINLFEDLMQEKIKDNNNKTVTFNMFCQELIEREYYD